MLKVEVYLSGRLSSLCGLFPLQVNLEYFLDPFQLGFRPGYGTETALVALFDDLCREKDRGNSSLSAAFDTIDHGVLLDRLAGIGMGGTVLQWFRSYLADRVQMVVLGTVALIHGGCVMGFLRALYCPPCYSTSTVHETAGGGR